MLIATIPPPHRKGTMAIASTPEIDAFRFNTGVSVPDPLSTLQKLRDLIPKDKPLWVDLKCRQLRVTSWADPNFCEVELNREIEVELPAQIMFRGSNVCEIAQVDGSKVYLADIPRDCVGKGQSVNILSNNLIIKGPLLNELDSVYLGACEEIGIKHLMVSYIESWQDVKDIADVAPQDTQIFLKIENEVGLQNIVIPTECFRGRIRLELARDDLFNELRGNPHKILQATKDVILRDAKALVASRFFSSVQKTGDPSLAEMEDVIFLYSLGYRNFMFQDELSDNPIILRKAAQTFQEGIRWAKEKQLQY